MQKKSFGQRIMGSMFWMGSGIGIQSLLQVLVMAILSRLLDAEMFGLMSATLVITNFADIFSQLGMGPALIQLKDIKKEDINTAFTATTLFGIGISIIVFLFSDIFSAIMGMDELNSIYKVFSIVFIVKGLSAVKLSLIEKEMRFKDLAFIDIVSYTVSFLFIGVMLAFRGYGVWSLVIANLSQAILKGVAIFIISKERVRFRISRDSLNKLLAVGSGFTISKILGYIANNIDYMLVGRLLGPSVLGIYSKAYQLMALPSNTLGKVVEQVFFPGVSKIQKERERVKSFYQNSFKFVSFIVLPITVIMWLFAPEIIEVVLGKGWEATVFPFRILTISMYFRTAQRLCNPFIKVIGNISQRIYVQAIYAALVMVGTYIGHFWGIEGVTIGVTTAIIINFILIETLCNKLIKIDWLEMLQVLKKPILLTVLVGGIFACIMIFTTKLNLYAFNKMLMDSVLGGTSVVIIILIFSRKIIGCDINTMYKNVLSLIKAEK